MSQEYANVVLTGRVKGNLAELPDQPFDLDLRAQAATSIRVETDDASGATHS